MTQPEPTPGAPATEPTTQPPTTASEPPASTPAAEDLASLPEWAQKQIRDARAEAAKSRTTAKQTAAEQARQETLAQVAKALGIGQEGEPVDPAQLTEQIEYAQAVAFRSSVQLSVYRAAGRLSADADALLDSNSFIDSLDDLTEDDPQSPEFAAAVEAKVQEALEKHPSKFRAGGQAPNGTTTPRPDPSQGTRGQPPAGRPKTLSEALGAEVRKQLAAKR